MALFRHSQVISKKTDLENALEKVGKLHVPRHFCKEKSSSNAQKMVVSFDCHPQTFGSPFRTLDSPFDFSANLGT